MPAEELKPIFSFLHISDLHFCSESAKAEYFRESVLKKIQDPYITPDCLIISGDIFHKGSLSTEDANRTIQYICNLRRAGSIPCYVTPGNHDVDRLACKKDENAYNKYWMRREIVRNKIKELLTNEQGEFRLDGREKDILYSEAFRDFHGFLSKARISPFNENASDPGSEQYCTAANYEVGVHYFDIPNLNSRIRIVLINTALLAGQSINGDEYRKKRADLRAEIDKERSDGHNTKAAKRNYELSRIQERFENDGELIIDEEVLPETREGRMSLSHKGLEILSRIGNQDEDGCVVTLFVGHHGIEYLSNATQDALYAAMENCGSRFYLCGHAHKAGYKIYTRNNFEAYQFQAGGLFLDGTKYAQCSFNYGCLTAGDNGTLELSICSHFQMETPSRKQTWDSESKTFPVERAILMDVPEKKPTQNKEKKIGTEQKDRIDVPEERSTWNIEKKIGAEQEDRPFESVDSDKGKKPDKTDYDISEIPSTGPAVTGNIL